MNIASDVVVGQAQSQRLLHAVIAIPVGTATMTHQGALTGVWQRRPLRRLDAAGAPVRPLLNWLEEESPPSVFAHLVSKRQHVDLWNEPIALSHGVEIVALELVEACPSTDTDLLVVHLRCPDNPTRLAHLSNVLVNTRAAHRELMNVLGIPVSASPPVRRGFGIAARPIEGASFEMSMTGGLAIVTGVEPKQLHGRLVLVALLVAVQYLGVRDVQEKWASPDAKLRKQAETQFTDLDRRFLWDEATHYAESREALRLYAGAVGVAWQRAANAGAHCR